MEPQSVKKIKNINLQTERNCFFAVIETNGEAIKYVENPSDDLIKVSLRMDGDNIRFLPEEKRTDDVYLLAAIHKARENLLKETPDVIAALSFLEEKSKHGYRDCGYTEFSRIETINGETIGKLSLYSSFKDIPLYKQFYEDYKCYLIKDLTIKDGKMSVGNNCLSSPKSLSYKSFKNIPNSMFYEDGDINESVLLNLIETSPLLIFEIPPDKIKTKFIYYIIKFNKIDFKKYPKIFDYIDFNNFMKAFSTYCQSVCSSGTWLIKGMKERLMFIIDSYAEKGQSSSANMSETIQKCFYITGAGCLKETDQAEILKYWNEKMVQNSK